MNDLLSSLLVGVFVGVVTLVGGYYFGVLRSRNERRDAAISEIFKEMMLFYRVILGWIGDRDPKGSPKVEPDLTWEEYSWKRYEIFIDAFQGNEIWLDGTTYKMIQEFAHAGWEIMATFSVQRAVNEPYEERRAAWDQLRKELLADKLNDASDALKDKMQVTPTTFVRRFRRLILRIMDRIEKKPNQADSD